MSIISFVSESTIYDNPKVSGNTRGGYLDTRDHQSLQSSNRAYSMGEYVCITCHSLLTLYLPNRYSTSFRRPVTSDFHNNPTPLLASMFATTIRYSLARGKYTPIPQKDTTSSHGKPRSPTRMREEQERKGAL